MSYYLKGTTVIIIVAVQKCNFFLITFVEKITAFTFPVTSVF